MAPQETTLISYKSRCLQSQQPTPSCFDNICCQILCGSKQRKRNATRQLRKRRKQAKTHLHMLRLTQFLPLRPPLTFEKSGCRLHPGTTTIRLHVYSTPTSTYKIVSSLLGWFVGLFVFGFLLFFFIFHSSVGRPASSSILCFGRSSVAGVLKVRSYMT